MEILSEIHTREDLKSQMTQTDIWKKHLSKSIVTVILSFKKRCGEMFFPQLDLSLRVGEYQAGCPRSTTTKSDILNLVF